MDIYKEYRPPTRKFCIIDHDRHSNMYVPTNIEELHYYSSKKLNFVIPDSVIAVHFINEYLHPLDFLFESLCIKELSFRSNSGHFFNNIPDNIETLLLIQLLYPLQNIPVTLKKILLFNTPKKEILFASKIPIGYEIYCLDREDQVYKLILQQGLF